MEFLKNAATAYEGLRARIEADVVATFGRLEVKTKQARDAVAGHRNPSPQAQGRLQGATAFELFAGDALS